MWQWFSSFLENPSARRVNRRMNVRMLNRGQPALTMPRPDNGNYLWISYFYSYLNATGRAGFVMSSQASSAGNDEKTVTVKLGRQSSSPRG